MKNNVLTKLFLGAMCMFLLLAVGKVSNAETKDFTLTLNRNGVGNDALSKKTIKAGGTAYENKCYVTTTSMQGSGIIYVKSIKYTDSTIKSKQDLSLNSSTSIGVKKSCEYNKSAPSGDSYYLQGRYAINSKSDTVKAVGRYTP